MRPYWRGSGQDIEVRGQCQYSHSHALCAALLGNIFGSPE